MANKFYKQKKKRKAKSKLERWEDRDTKMFS